MAKKTMLDEFGLAGLISMIDPEAGKKLQPVKPEMKDRLTGTVFLMEQGDHKDGREFYMVLGVVAMPKGLVKDMHSFPVFGVPRQNHIELVIATDQGEAHPDFHGHGAAAILTTDIWRV